MKTYTVKNIEKLEQICFKYENGLEENSYPEDFWSLYYCNRDGGAVEPELATYANFQVYDFDGLHDFDYLKARLIEAGLEIPGTEKEWDGWGECEWGNKTLYGYDLQLPAPAPRRGSLFTPCALNALLSHVCPAPAILARLGHKSPV